MSPGRGTIGDGSGWAGATLATPKPTSPIPFDMMNAETATRATLFMPDRCHRNLRDSICQGTDTCLQRQGDCRVGACQDAGYEPAPRLSFAKPRSLSLFPSQDRSIVGASGSEAARTTLTAGDFDTVYQLGAVFDVLGMVAATERARGNPSGFELHVFDGTRTNGHVLAFEETGHHEHGCYSGAGSSRSAISAWRCRRSWSRRIFVGWQ